MTNFSNRGQLLQALLGSSRKLAASVALAGTVLLGGAAAASPAEKVQEQRPCVTANALEDRAKQLALSVDRAPETNDDAAAQWYKWTKWTQWAG